MVRHLEGEILKHIGEWESGESMTAIDETYRAKRMTADQAVALVPSGARLAMPMIAAEPPALLAALAARARAGEVRDLHLYYMLSAGIAGQSVLAPTWPRRSRRSASSMAASSARWIRRGCRPGRRPSISCPATSIRCRACCASMSASTRCW
ncbi:hypothetical protein [Hankyongella ginsenosidimutans]|uniref:hypothetical protein n=1 Tax=Hankyongella ginsenosidimutans TaxID=1763828 RepID=UPI002482C9C9|nr:hypothetical protein [Hankyongella ginsenosidimutans]